MTNCFLCSTVSVGASVGLVVGVVVGSKAVGIAVDVGLTVEVTVGDAEGTIVNVGAIETGGTAQAANNVMITMPQTNLRGCFIRHAPFDRLRFHLTIP
jgi:hypothetical protein